MIFSISSAQVKTNFEIIQNEIEKNIDQLIYKLDNKNSFGLEINLPNEYSIFSTVIKNKFGSGLSITYNNVSHNISYSLNEIQLNYTDCFRDGLFGNFLTERKLVINSSYNLSSQMNSLSGENIITVYKDTVKIEEIVELENNAYTFTRSEKPKEPFLSGLTEPIIAISAIAVSIYLLFSVRSN